MNRLYIAIILFLVAVSAALVLSYQFYFKEKFQQYSDAEKELKTLTGRLTELQNRFKGRQPDEYLQTLGDVIAPLAEAASVRSQYFNMTDFWKEEEVPEDVKVPFKFYYERQYREREEALRQDALAHVPPTVYPLDIFQTFGAPDPSTMANTAVVRKDVQRWLTRMNFAAAVTRMLIKANAWRIDEITLWPPREEFEVLEMRTVGLSFWMRAEDLVNFLQSLQRENRYFNVNGLRIRNSNLLSDPAYGSPYLQVEMLLTFSNYIEGKQATGAAADAKASAGASGAPIIQGAFGAFGGGANKERPNLRKKKPWWKFW